MSIRTVRHFSIGSSDRDTASTRVVRITTRLNVGGIARHVAWLTAGLEAQGFETTLVAGTVPAGEDDMSPFALRLGVVPHTIPEMSRELSLKDLVTVWKVFRLLCKLKPTVLHTHAAKAGAVGRVAGWLYRWMQPGALLGRPRRCVVVHTYHGHIFHSYYGPLKTKLFLWIERLLARLATDRIVTISPQQFEEIHRTYRVGRAEQFSVVPLGLDLEPYADAESRRHELREELRLGIGDVLVGIVGRLTEIKNHELFLQAAALYLQRHASEGPRVRFLIVGNGHRREYLEGLARQLGIDEDVLFLGNREDPARFYPALDIVALTSHNEGTPLTVIEGMANGRPAVATSVGGVVDLLGSAEGMEETGFSVAERGILVRPGDAEGFAAALHRLVSDPDLRHQLGVRGQMFVRRHHTRERLLGDITRLYRSFSTSSEGSRCEEPVARGATLVSVKEGS